MEDITLQELKALVAENSRALAKLEELQAQDREQWQEELAASRREHDRRQADLDRQDRERMLVSRQQWQEELAASRREHDRRQADLDRHLGELGNQMNVSRQQWQEELAASRQQWQEELAASRKQWQEELAASRREHDRMLASLERSMDNANRQLGQLGNQIGELNEAAFYPSLERVLRQGQRRL